MDIDLQRSRKDRAIATREADQLDRAPFVENLIRALVIDGGDKGSERRGSCSTGYVVGLTGEWGLGKSSVLNLIYGELQARDDVIVAHFNPWLFSGRDELVAGFFQSLRSAMGKSGSEKAHVLINAINRYSGAIKLVGHGTAAVVDLYGGAGAATAGYSTWLPRISAAWKALTGKKEVLNPEDERRLLEEKISEANCAVVVLIDELDRVEDSEVRAVAQLVKAVGDIEGISYLVAYDPERVIEALGRGTGPERELSGARYLEKIIQYPFPLRPLFSEETRTLLEAALIEHEFTLIEPSDVGQQELLEKLLSEISTPRDVKRLIGAFHILERAVRDEICPYDVLAYCWILTKAPTVRDRIASKVDELVNDPSQQRFLTRSRQLHGENEASVVEVLGEAARDHETILNLLFPRFKGKRHIDVSTSSTGNRLQQRRNLVRMLYLGNPPGAFRRAELESLWNTIDTSELETVLRQAMESGKLNSIIDRLEDYHEALSEAGDQTFWIAVSRALVRKTDWLRSAEVSRFLADDAAASLYRVGLRETGKAERFRRALDALIAQGDLILTPWILRKHLFAHGLTWHDEKPRGGEIFDVIETKDLVARQLTHYRKAVLDGYALRRLPDTEIFYLISNLGEWDQELRAALTDQLITTDALTTFAGLFVPPNTSMEYSTLNELFDAEIVRSRVDALMSEDELSEDPWLAECLQRFQVALSGQDL
ncbi:KAP family NTPase [Roseibium album]|uniref:KAP family NTPase n=1 Tax=Roseibium album TaxID=311410 RepID=UPI003296A9FC